MATDRNRDLDVNVVADVEYAELGPDIARKVGEPVEHRRSGPPELADDDLLVGELDKDGHGSQVFVAKGDPIPSGLASLPRAPARGAPRKR
jgi:hypothetical protein